MNNELADRLTLKLSDVSGAVTLPFTNTHDTVAALKVGGALSQLQRTAVSLLDNWLQHSCSLIYAVVVIG